MTVTVDATGLAEGVYHDAVAVASNDAGSPAELAVTLVYGIGGAVAIGDVPAGTAASVSCQPNPFNPRTTVTFAMPADGRAVLRLYDTRGRLARTLAAGPFAAGRHEAPWDGRDDRGRACPSGIYLLRLERDGAVPVSGKAVLVR